MLKLERDPSEQIRVQRTGETWRKEIKEMPPGGAFPNTGPTTSLCQHSTRDTAGRLEGMGSERPVLALLPLPSGTLAPPSLTGPQPLGLTQGFAKASESQPWSSLYTRSGLYAGT